MKKTTASLNSNGNSRIYRREAMEALKPTTNHSLQYSRKQARDIFARYPDVQVVEYVYGGRKLDSQIVGRGDAHAPAGYYVIISSTGGRWGKCRRCFAPQVA